MSSEIGINMSVNPAIDNDVPNTLITDLFDYSSNIYATIYSKNVQPIRISDIITDNINFIRIYRDTQLVGYIIKYSGTNTSLLFVIRVVDTSGNTTYEFTPDPGRDFPVTYGTGAYTFRDIRGNSDSNNYFEDTPTYVFTIVGNPILSEMSRRILELINNKLVNIKGGQLSSLKLDEINDDNRKPFTDVFNYCLSKNYVNEDVDVNASPPSDFFLKNIVNIQSSTFAIPSEDTDLTYVKRFILIIMTRLGLDIYASTTAEVELNHAVDMLIAFEVKYTGGDVVSPITKNMRCKFINTPPQEQVPIISG